MYWNTPPKKAYEEAEMHGCEIHVSDRADFSFTARSDEAIARAVSPLV